MNTQMKQTQTQTDINPSLSTSSPALGDGLPIEDTWILLEHKLNKLGWQGLIKQRRRLMTSADEMQRLLEYCELELQHQNQTSLERRLKQSKLPIVKHISQFDWAWPKGHTEALKSLLTLEFIDERRNPILIGEPGSGKTMFVSGLGEIALTQGLNVYYASTFHLLEKLNQIDQIKPLRNALNKLAGYDLLILDGLGYRKNMTNRQADLLYEIIDRRHNIKSTVVTTNLLLGQWHSLFESQVSITPTIDRLVERSIRIELKAESYRHKMAMEQNSLRL